MNVEAESFLPREQKPSTFYSSQPGQELLYNNLTDRLNETKNKNFVKKKQNQFRIPGYFDSKALYLMRGLSGSGKSTHAKRIVQELGRGEIFSTDEFFYLNEANEYRFEHDDLERAHEWNKERVFGALSEGISPVIVDNTNTQFWEMRPYAIEAVENNYNCYFIEPPTTWKFDIKQLLKKSTHGLSRSTLVAALNRYERNPTVEKVIGNGYKPKTSSSPVTHVSSQKSNRANQKTNIETQKESKRGLSRKSDGSNNRQPSAKLPQKVTRTGRKNLVPYSSDSDSAPSAPSTPKYTIRTNAPSIPKHKNKRNNPPKSEKSNFKNRNGTRNETHHDREHSNNSDYPKVRPRCNPVEKCRVLEGNFESPLFNDCYTDVYNDWNGSCEGDSAEKNRKTPGHQNSRAMPGHQNNRVMEDRLLQKLENDNVGIVEDGLVGLLEQQHIHKSSARKLTMWGDHDQNYLDDDTVQQDDAIDWEDEIPEIWDDDTIPAAWSDETEHIPLSDKSVGINTDKKSNKCGNTTSNGNINTDKKSNKCGSATSNGNHGNAVSTLRELCYEKLKTVLIVSFYSSAHYKDLHDGPTQIPPLSTESQSLPEPPSLAAEERDQPSTVIPAVKMLFMSHKWREFASVTHEFIESNCYHGNIESGTRGTGLLPPCQENVDDARDKGEETRLEESRLEESGQESKQHLLEEEPENEEDLTDEQIAIMENVKNAMGYVEKLRAVCEECFWDENEIVEYLLLKSSLQELTDEAGDVNEGISRFRSPPPSIRKVLKLSSESGSDERQSGSNNEQQTGSNIEQDIENSFDIEQDRKRYDSIDSTEVGSILLDPETVSTLTQLFGRIVGLPGNQQIRVPVNLDLASQLHAALYFAQVDSTVRNKGNKQKTKQLCNALTGHRENLKFNEIVKQQSQKAPRTRQLKRLMHLYPGVDEQFLSSLLDSCGNNVRAASTILKQENIYIPPHKDSYSTKAESCPSTPPSDNTQYLYLNSGVPTTHSTTTLVNSGTPEEQIVTWERLAEQSFKQAALAHASKLGHVATHHALQAKEYKDCAAAARRKLFNKSVPSLLQELKKKPLLDLHGFTLSQSKVLVERAIQFTPKIVLKDSETPPNSLTIITGKGLHSAGRVPVLKNGIRNLLLRRSLLFSELDDGFKVKFK